MSTPIITALALDAAFGDPERGHPVAGFGRLATALERVMWRDSRLAGAAHAIVLVVGSAVAAAAVERRLGRARPAFAPLALWATLGRRSLAEAAGALASAVAAEDMVTARRLAPTLVGRDVTDLDASELCRAAIESVAENTTDAVVAPLFWFAVLGAPGAIAYRSVNTLDAIVGHRSPRYERFGWFAARLDDALSWLPARLATAAAVASAPVVGSAHEALRALPAASAHPSPNAGLIEAAFAGALAVRLGGRNRYRTRLEERPLLGPAGTPSPADVARAVQLSAAVTLVAAATLIAVGWWR
jgi:adenosylcobinamide-phosphate synthase